MKRVWPRDVRWVESGSPTLEFAGQQGERLRITVLDHGLIRVQHWPDGTPRQDRTWTVVGADGDVPREGRLREDLSPFPLPPFEVHESDGVVTLRTEALNVTVSLGDFRLSWADAAGRSFAADTARAYVYDTRGTMVSHALVRRADEHYYGFGEVAGPLDKAGMRLRLEAVDAYGYDAAATDPLYKHWPFYVTYAADLDLAYGLFYDNFASGVFDLGKEVDALRGAAYRTYEAQSGDLDYTLIYGPTIEAVCEQFAELIGRPALPPRWSLGYLGSTMSYTEAPDAQARLGEFVDLCAQHEIPCDLFHLSSGYTTDSQGRRNVFTWNRDRIPDPPGMAARFHAAGIKLAANIKPWLLKTHPRYGEVAAAGGFVKGADADAPEISLFWSGGLYESAEGSYFDFTSAAGYEWWQARVKDALLDAGIDAVWNDNNEFQLPDDDARCAGFDEPVAAQDARPLLTLLMGQASYRAIREHVPDQRPLLLTRSGCPGIQRYAQTWSGDNATSWATLRHNLPMGLGAGLSGLVNTGHDVGGFAGPKPDAELFARWVQCGIFYPRFTIHSWNADGTVNEPWMHPDALPLVREAMRFRYRLIPYLYSLFFEAAQTGHPIMRPLVYAFPQDARCRTESFDFLLGPSLLVAPVMEPGARTRRAYLPPGQAWCDFYTGTWHAGGQEVEVETPPEHIPLFVRAGGIVPLGKAMKHVGAEPDDLREALIFPAPEGGHGEFTLVEDDGVSFGYQRGEVTRVTLAVDSTPDAITLAAPVVEGGYALPYREIVAVLPSGERRPLHAPPGSLRLPDVDGRQRVRLRIDA